MTKRETYLGLAVLALALMFTIGCNKGGDSPTAPVVTGSGSGSPGANAVPDSPATATPPAQDEDASGGRALSAQFLSTTNPWPAKLTNTTHNPGVVSYCVYDLQGPGGWGNQGNPVHSEPFSVAPLSELEVDIYDVYKPGECEVEITGLECELGEEGAACKATSNIPALWSVQWAQAVYEADLSTRTVEPVTSIEFSTPFPRSIALLELIVRAKASCGDALTFQADLIRGTECGQAPANHGGHNFGHVYGTLEETQRSEDVAERKWNFECVPKPRGEPVVKVEEGEWGECQVPTSVPSASVREECKRFRTETTTTTQNFTCGQLPKITVTTETVNEPCECPCIEEGPIGPVDIGDPFGWGEPIEGKCPVPTASTKEEVCFEHQFGTQQTEIQYTCKDNEKGEREVCREAEVDCPCIPEWSEWVEGEESCGEWSECIEQPHVGDLHSLDLRSSCRSECHMTQECTVELTRTQTCTGATETKQGEPHTHSEECECPVPEPKLCYYNVNSNLGPVLQRITCERKMGGDPLAPGQWGRWPEGPPSDHCMFTVPGIFDDRLRLFQLTPGQSDPACNKY